MATPSGIAAGLAFLSSLVGDFRERSTLELLLTEWVKASGWKSAGLAWPLSPEPKLIWLASENRLEPLVQPPAEWRDAVEALADANETVKWQVPDSAGRIYALFQPPGRPSGLIWAERDAMEPWKDDDRSYFGLSVKMIERSSTLGTTFGASIDSERLHQRLGDAAVIAGRMAHDFDNILTGIIGFADLTLPLLVGQSLPTSYVQEIAKVGQRGIVFTQQLHQLSRSGQTKPQPGQVAAALAREDLRLRPAMPAGMKLKIDIPAGLAPVAMDAGPLQTMLGHLLENAIEAGSAGSGIAVSVRAVELNLTEAKAFLGRVGSGVHLEVIVRDAGSGIKPGVAAKLFAEPFFTTKVRHRGLGLATVFRILHAHRAGVRIDAAAPPEIGTIVRVVVPLASIRPAVVSAAAVGSPLFQG